MVGLGGKTAFQDLDFDGGKIIAVGTSIASGGAKLAVVRLNPGGGLDSSFDGDGVAFGCAGRRPDHRLVRGRAVGRQGGRRRRRRQDQVGGVSPPRGLLSNGASTPAFGPDGNGWAVTGSGPRYRRPSSSRRGRVADRGWDQVGHRPRRRNKLSADGVTDTAFGTSGQHGYTFSIDAAAYGPGRRFVVAGGPGMHAAPPPTPAQPRVGRDAQPARGRGRPHAGQFLRLPLRRCPADAGLLHLLRHRGVASEQRHPRLPADYTGVVAPPPSDVIYRDTGYVDIPANETFAAVTITPIDDTPVEGNETAVFTVRPDPAYDVGDPGAVTMSIVDDDAPPPQVAAVFANGSTWAPSVSTVHPGRAGRGIADLGFSIAGGAGQLETLPWVNVDTVSVRFTEDVSVAAANLSLRGVNVATYAFSAYQYDAATHTATWTLAQPLRNDKVLLDLDGDAGGVNAAAALLDGDWTTAGTFPSGDGAAGGDFKFRFNVLPGDTTRSGASSPTTTPPSRRSSSGAPPAPTTGTDRPTPSSTTWTAAAPSWPTTFRR